ncbi:hypothetical protein, partial [Lyngbya sp. CCY1209]|uniref:hypothetical protein n=1 Tax=Lyngbya sp. CCY1209 TaxID=2886103 RepID=UPI002D2152E1
LKGIVNVPLPTPLRENPKVVATFVKKPSFNISGRHENRNPLGRRSRISVQITDRFIKCCM